MNDKSLLYNSVNSIDIGTLELLLKDPSTVTGTIHKNGFHKLTLKGAGRGPVLRAHIWMADRQYEEIPGNIHNHRWGFASKILVGSITTTSFVASNHTGQVYEHYLYNPDADPDMLYVGPVMLERQGAEILNAGQCYYLDAQIIHRAEPLVRQPTVTLIARSEPKRKAADVYCTQRMRELSGPLVSLSETQVLCDLQYVYELLLAETANIRHSP